MYNYDPYMGYDMDMYGYNMYMPEEYQPGCMMPMQMPMQMPMYPEKMPTPKEKKCIKVPEIIGKNYTQILLQTLIPFPRAYPCFEVKDIKSKVKDLHLQICSNKVVINGKLEKNIAYKTLEKCCVERCDCTDIDIAYGDIRHVTVCIPFSGYIEIPGAMIGDKVEVCFAGVEDSCEVHKLMGECFVRGCYTPVFSKLEEKVVVKIEVKVMRNCHIKVDNPEECDCEYMC